MSLTVPPPVTITSATHRFFDDLVTAVASHAALTAGYVAHAQGTAYRFLDDRHLSMSCLTRREGRSILEIEVTPATILTPLTKFSWPMSLDLRFTVVTDCTVQVAASSPPPAVSSTSDSLTGMQRVFANIHEHAFIAYYERFADEINLARSKGNKPTLAFANIVRNAFAHGGCIHFVGRKANTTVTWNGLTYSIGDNDRRIIYNDMSLGDIILLMLEMDSMF